MFEFMICGFVVVVNLNKVGWNLIIIYDVVLVLGFYVNYILSYIYLSLVFDIGIMYFEFRNRICFEK